MTTPTEKPDPRNRSSSDPSENWSCREDDQRSSAGPLERLEELMNQPGNRICADCGSPEPKWVSLNHGIFICIKCSGVHRSLGAHISKVLSVKLDLWTDDQVDLMVALGGNTTVNMKYEAFLQDIKKPRPDSSIEERSDFIRRKYEHMQFFNPNEKVSSSHPSTTLSSLSRPSTAPPPDKKNCEKQSTGHRIHAFGHAFHSSRKKKETEHKSAKNSNSAPGMVEFIGLIKVNIVRGTNLAVRDMITSDPYVILSLGQQSMKTRVIKNNLNPVWNERLMLSIPDTVPPLKVLVYDKDTFTPDDHMGEAEIDIQPLVYAAQAYENSKTTETIQLGKWLATNDNTLVKDSVITLTHGKVKQEITLRLQNVERGVLEIELECVPLSQ
ncbi:PREDICTED: probable ADP-ribosylation factor GTPase-activating protein AGD11 [Nelumbo nucifera]|uniref:Probable ADP-ribosylation factor GTPase-activating protein AGD11 n=1 Tax=Nelumbo nucifera TaxID=4432 RepID=A0A1U8B1V4_NELNU|nr:PREDICTED: probable ADP-ribosylation factor GTPase-activating protein AGD11 [Nelumbo nucifera]XP_010273191.1 PREDICTED: probable ADP-ribosylation factor GTPase-activating protein AGD11 [Nelumbo nucifera]